MKADSSLQLRAGDYGVNAVECAARVMEYDDYYVWGVSPDTRVRVLETVISSLAERRRDLQSRLTTLLIAEKTHPGVFQDDRVLDEYAEYAERVEENAIRAYNDKPRRASSLLPYCRTVYHIPNLTVEVAEKLWQNGFRDIDVQDKNGRTPLMLGRPWNDMVAEFDVCSWLIQRGAELDRPQHGPLNYESDRALDPIDLAPTTRALHYVAANIGCTAGYITNIMLHTNTKHKARKLTDDEIFNTSISRLQDQLNQLSEDARLLPATLFSDVSCDDCICACASQGCIVSTIMLKEFGRYRWTRISPRQWSPLATRCLITLAGPHNSCWAWLDEEVIRFRTFQELELRHTCCQWKEWDLMTKLDPEERAEIREEDHEKIELLEILLQEFEENRGTQDLISFFEGYWATRMDQVLQEQGDVDEEALREMGIVLYPEATGGRA